jgi:hypothetical protein
MGKEVSVLSCSSTVESSIEFDACYHFEYSPDVKTFEAQPIGFKYKFNGRICKYTPDFKIEFVDNRLPVYIEIKPFSKTFKSDFRERYECRQIAAAQMNVPLVLITQKEIRQKPLLENLKILHRYASHDEVSSDQLQLLGIISEIGPVRIEQAQQLIDLPAEQAFIEVMGLLSKSDLMCDVEQNLIDLSTEVWVNHVQ